MIKGGGGCAPSADILCVGAFVAASRRPQLGDYDSAGLELSFASDAERTPALRVKASVGGLVDATINDVCPPRLVAMWCAYRNAVRMTVSRVVLPPQDEESSACSRGGADGVPRASSLQSLFEAQVDVELSCIVVRAVAARATPRGTTSQSTAPGVVLTELSVEHIRSATFVSSNESETQLTTTCSIQRAVLFDRTVDASAAKRQRVVYIGCISGASGSDDMESARAMQRRPDVVLRHTHTPGQGHQLSVELETVHCRYVADIRPCTYGFVGVCVVPTIQPSQLVNKLPPPYTIPNSVCAWFMDL